LKPIHLVFDTNLISLAYRRCCEEIFELVYLFLIVAALFIGNGVFFTFPKGDGNTFAGFSVAKK